MIREDTLVVENFVHERLDIYLASKLGHTRSKIKKLIESGNVKVNGKIRSSHFKVSPGERIDYELSKKEKSQVYNLNINVPVNIIHEEDHFAIIDKSPGIVVHPAPGNREGTLLDGLRSRFKNPHLVHRLDKDTSGLLVIALDEKSALNLRNQFKKRIVKKIYLAIVEGVIEEEAEEISAPIKRSRKDPTRMMVGWSDAKESTTRFKVKKRLNTVTFVEVYMLSGRTHQIRVHFSYFSHPVLGDNKYSKQSNKAPRQMLHAWRISFEHPVSNERVYFESPMPEDFKVTLDKFEKIK